MITACENGCLEIITMRTITIPGPRYNEIQPSDSMHPVSAQLIEEIDKDKNKAQERDSKTYEKPVRAVPIQVRGGRDALQTRSLRLTCILQQVRTSTDSLNCQFVGRPAPPPAPDAYNRLVPRATGLETPANYFTLYTCFVSSAALENLRDTVGETN